ncbi:MAG: EAL domain-containing protein [Eggerthellaceae bacterium]|nr:EAL domain-containing protein [Eggerthellaceae bacterium]
MTGKEDAMASGLLSLFSNDGPPLTIVEYLDRSSYDELAEIDLVNDRCRNIFHVEGKYFVPVTDGSYHSQYDYCIDNMVHPDDRDIFARFMDPDTVSQRLAEAEIPGAMTAQYRYKLQDGGWRWTEVCLIGDGRHGIPEGIIRFYIFDIENQMSRARVGMSGRHYVATTDHDDRTGLVREQPFLARIGGIIEGAEPERWCLIAIDLDHFKLFNEWYGREEGDFLLAEIGARLSKEEQTAGGLAGYRGGDDFCLLTPFDKDRIDNLFDDLCAIVSARRSAVGFMPVFGISMVEGPITSMDLLDQAIIAAGKAKADFRKRICIFRQPMREQEEKEYRILSDFLRGLENGEIFFELQPQCRMSTGKIVGVEALARWRRADGTMVSPLDFIPVLERHGFVTTLDCYIWEEVCSNLQAWVASGRTPIPVSVNVSQVDFYLIDIPDYFQGLVDQYELDPSLLKIEVTESAYVNNMAVIHDATTRLREKGFLVLMDDFGSGYSSLNTLRDLSVDVIKLDAQFLRIRDDKDHKGIHILESVINMAKSMNLPIISEGVETEEQSQFLERQGCRYVQGYKFYRPMSPEQFEEIIGDGEILDTRGFIVKSNEQIRTRELFDENVYSDSMLNNILGPVAMYSWNGSDVDIVRFNEQFYETINSPAFHDLLHGIQKLMPRDERPKLFHLLSQAEDNVLNGSEGMLRFLRYGGAVNRYYFRFYYLGRRDGGRLFYGSVRDVTELTELQGQMKLLSRFSSDSMVFVRKFGGGIVYKAVTHGLERAMGLTAEEFQDELASGAFINRIVEDDVRATLKDPDIFPIQEMSLRFHIRTDSGELLDLSVKSDAVDDEATDVLAILVFRAN